MPSHKTASCSAMCRASSPPLKWVNGHSLTMFWFPTAAVRIGGLAPPEKVDCTSTLSHPESVQHWPVLPRKVEARRTYQWLSYEGVVHNISRCLLITPCRIGCHALCWRVQPDRFSRWQAGCWMQCDVRVEWQLVIYLDFSQLLGSGLQLSEMWWWYVAEIWQPW